MRKGEAQQRLLDFFLSTCHTRSGWLASLRRTGWFLYYLALSRGVHCIHIGTCHTQVPHWHFPSVQWLPGGELWVMWKTKWVIQLPSEEIFCILKLNLPGRGSNAGNKTGGCPHARSPGEHQHQHQVWIYILMQLQWLPGFLGREARTSRPRRIFWSQQTSFPGDPIWLYLDNNLNTMLPPGLSKKTLFLLQRKRRMRFLSRWRCPLWARIWRCVSR